LMRSPVSELLAAVRSVMAGGTYITSLIAAMTIRARPHVHRGARHRRDIYQLTGRQRAILELIVAGKTAKEVPSCSRYLRRPWNIIKQPCSALSDCVAPSS
jgi:DNA-binding NarL/FixJ family response regulator